MSEPTPGINAPQVDPHPVRWPLQASKPTPVSRQCNGVLRPGLRLTATRVPWCRHHPLWRGDLAALPKDVMV